MCGSPLHLDRKTILVEMTGTLVKDEQIKEAIIQAAQKIFQQYGLTKTTMEDIAKAMGKGKSTLYYYFSSKEDIFVSVINKEINEVFDSMVTACQQQQSARSKIEVVIKTKVRALHDKLNLYRILSTELPCSRDMMESCRIQFSQREIDLFVEILQFGIDHQEFNESIQLNLPFLAYVVVSAFRGLEFDLFFSGTDLDAKIDLLLSIIVKGLQ